MSQSMARAREQSSGPRQYLLGLYYLAAGNLSLTTVAVGAVVYLLGGLVVVNYHDVLGPMVAIWGISIAVLGAVSYALLWINKMRARVTD